MFIMMSGLASASVTMTGTRVIYRGENKSVDVQLKNKDKYPYVIQTWFDEGNIEDGPDKSVNIPFVATPPVFRIQPATGQVVRITFSGTRILPQDRESVFYFNFLQIPPANIGGSGSASQNKMTIMLRNRVKVFYRPEGLPRMPGKMLSTLKVTAMDEKTAAVSITNGQPYFLALSNVELSGAGKKFNAKADMIPPFSSRVFHFTGSQSTKNKTVTVTMINDQGARISENYSL